MSAKDPFITEIVDGQYLNVMAQGKPGRICIKLGDEGFGVTIYQDVSDEPVVETWATYQELEPEKAS